MAKLSKAESKEVVAKNRKYLEKQIDMLADNMSIRLRKREGKMVRVQQGRGGQR